jgi:hypothetical protein
LLGGVRVGQKVARDHPAVRENPSAFVEVTRGLDRSASPLVAKETLRITTADGEERIVYQAQWLRRDDTFAQVFPHHVEPVAPEPWIP